MQKLYCVICVNALLSCWKNLFLYYLNNGLQTIPKFMLNLHTMSIGL